MAKLLDSVEVETASRVDASVIWLHGLGADGHDFEPVVAQLDLPADVGVRFIFPHAPIRPVTLNQGMAMRAWFDIFALDRQGPQDDRGIRESAAHVEDLIAHEVQRGIARERIVLAGFSQGGAIALHVGLRSAQPLAGIMGLSTYLPQENSFDAEAAEANRATPLFLAHGSYDPVLPMTLGQFARDFLIARGYKPEWHTYPMPHAVCPEEIDDIGRWLAKSLNAALGR